MHIQVWKPDSERPGRHCVYVERYVRLMAKILWVCDDKATMEALTRRVRKKANELFRFNNVWTECCSVYLKLIRRAGNIEANVEDVFFKGIPHEEFEIFSDRLTDWIAKPEMAHPALEALREAHELKKTNGGQMKPAPIDDLINDCWAVLYTEVGKGLPGPDPAAMHSGLQQAQTDGTIDAPIRTSMGPMSLNNLVMNMDGTEIAVPLTFAPAEPGRPRKVGVSRREVLRRAEAAVSKAPEAPRSLLPSNPPPPASILNSNAPSVDNEQSNGAGGDDTEVEGSNEGGAKEGEKEKTGEDMEREASSEKGSLHDSADDESDLSDVPDMDEVDSAMIFPDTDS